MSTNVFSNLLTLGWHIPIILIIVFCFVSEYIYYKYDKMVGTTNKEKLFSLLRKVICLS